MSEAARKRVLGIVGSPRRGGNTEILVDEALAGAEEAGALTEKVILSELEIGPCRGCDACGKTGQCVQQDDLPALLEQMERSQVWVLGTPVYYWGPTAQFKAFVDRWALNIQVYWLPTNASWLDQIEIWFSILQRKLLQPNHFERLGSLKSDIMNFIAYHNQTAKPIQWTYTVEKLEQKLGTN